ncbi:MAG: hypothetical protein V4628_04500 [Pseudomonadota bacterium]
MKFMHVSRSFEFVDVVIRQAVGVASSLLVLRARKILRWCVFKAMDGTSKSSKQGKVLINYGGIMAKAFAGPKLMTFAKKIGYSQAHSST